MDHAVQIISRNTHRFGISHQARCLYLPHGQSTVPQAYHVNYHTDCMRLYDFVFPHDDAVNDRAAGGKLETAWGATKVCPRPAIQHSNEGVLCVYYIECICHIPYRMNCTIDF